jgi:hypothetical protein
VSRITVKGDRVKPMRLAMMTSGLIAAAGVGYLVSLLLNVPAGFPMPPAAATRVMASLSVLVSAPSLAVFAYSMNRAFPSRAATMAFAILVIFAAVAVANRITQVVVLELWPEHGQQLDLYVTNSFAQAAEMLAWGWLFGAGTVLLAGAVRVAGGPLAARLLGASGLLSLAAGLVYVASLIATLPDWVGGVAVAVGGLAWGIVWPASAALFMSVGRRRALA